MKAALLRYAPWQLRDYLRDRGLITFALATIIAGLAWMAWREQALAAGMAPGAMNRGQAAGYIGSVFGFFAWFGTLTAVNGLASNDRTRGYFRLLFSRPVSVTWYYLQLWTINGLGLILVLSLLLGLFSLLVVPFYPPSLLLWIAVYWTFLGGVGFLLSALTRFDGIALVVFFLISALLRAAAGAATGTGARIVRVVALPVDRAHGMLQPVLDGGAISRDAIGILVYGLVALTLGILVLRWKELAR